MKKKMFKDNYKSFFIFLNSRFNFSIFSFENSRFRINSVIFKLRDWLLRGWDNLLMSLERSMHFSMDFINSVMLNYRLKPAQRYFSGLAFLGRPLPGTLRMASRAEGSYIAPRSNGFIPALNSRISTVLTGIFNASDISTRVNPSMIKLSEEKEKKLVEITTFTIDNCSYYNYN